MVKCHSLHPPVKHFWCAFSKDSSDGPSGTEPQLPTVVRKQLTRIAVLAVLPSLSPSPRSLTSASGDHLPIDDLHHILLSHFALVGNPTKRALTIDVLWGVNEAGHCRVEPCLYRPVQLIYRHLFRLAGITRLAVPMLHRPPATNEVTTIPDISFWVGYEVLLKTEE